MGHYEPKYDPFFDKQLRRIRRKKRDIGFERRVNRIIEDLREDPRHNAPFAKGQYRGKRYRQINPTDRLLFAICEECREENHQRFNRCLDCDQVADNVFVVFLMTFGHWKST